MIKKSFVLFAVLFSLPVATLAAQAKNGPAPYRFQIKPL